MYGDAVIVKNVGSTVFRDRFNGKEYVVQPGKIQAVPKAAAKLWLGDWELSGREQQVDVERARLRRGRLPNLEIVSDPPESEDGSVDPPTEEEEALLKELRQGAAYVFPDGTRIAKKVEALAYLRGLENRPEA